MERPFRGIALIAAAIGLCAATVASGNPPFPVVVPNGKATFGNLQTNPGAIMNWQQFSIGANETTRFVQQSASSAVFDRVSGVNPSVILGNLQSNSRVFLVNPNGIVFGGQSVAGASGVIAPGNTIELSDPKSPGIIVEVKAPANRPVNVQQLVDLMGKRDVTSALTFNGGGTAATMAVRDAAGNIFLKAAP